jgi:hypothetical protein
MANYAPSTRARIADLVLGMHVKTTDAILAAANFTTGGTNTTMFNVYGRIGIRQLFIELTAAADVNATQVAFYCTFTTPTIALNLMGAKCASIASLGAHGRIVHVGGAVATAAIITDSAGLTDVDMAGKMTIIGGETAAGGNTVGVIGMQASDATQAGTITATGHIWYVPMSDGAYVQAAL